MASRITPSPGRHRPSAGFTLLELAVVVTIIGIISAIALPAYQRIQRNTRFGALINDYRVLTSAFQQYSAVNASWPAYSGTKGAFPQGMEEYLRTTNWSQATVFGGRYNWEQDVTHNGRKVKAAIAIYTADDRPLTMTSSEMQTFDQRYDDGDLASGYFQKGYQDCPLYIIEDDPLRGSTSSTTPVAEASLDDIAALPDPQQQAADAAKLAAEQAAKEAADKAAAEQAAKEAADKAAAEEAAKEAAKVAAAEEAAKKVAADQATKEAAEKAAAEQAAKAASDKAAKDAAEKAAADAAAKAAADQAAKEAADIAAAEQAAKEAAEKAAEAAKNTPVALATTRYNDLVAQAANLSVKVPNSLINALNKFTAAAKALEATDPEDTKLVDKNTKTYETTQKNADNALDSFAKTIAKEEAKK